MKHPLDRVLDLAPLEERAIMKLDYLSKWETSLIRDVYHSRGIGELIYWFVDPELEKAWSEMKLREKMVYRVIIEERVRAKLELAEADRVEFTYWGSEPTRMPQFDAYGFELLVIRNPAQQL